MFHKIYTNFCLIAKQNNEFIDQMQNQNKKKIPLRDKIIVNFNKDILSKITSPKELEENVERLIFHLRQMERHTAFISCNF